MIVHDKLFIGGELVDPSGSDTIDVISPVTEEVFGRVPAGTTADIDRAVAAARSALTGPWAQFHPEQRADLLAALAVQIHIRHEEIAQTITDQNGCPIQFSIPGQALGAVFYANYMADLTRTFPFEEERIGLTGTVAHVLREPVGVVAAIVPWNAPLLLALLKVAPALASGCTVVVKPAPETPLDSYIFAECLQAAGVPAGVVNIVAADREVGEHLVTHPGVDKVAFTGSSAAGRRIAGLCGELIRPVTLELGGKSAAIVCDDADLSLTVPGLVGSSTMINGQACVLQSRVLVSRDRYSEIVDGMVEGFRALTVGDPSDPETMIGPLVAERQRDRVEGYISSGISQGAKVAFGGGRPEHMKAGWFVEPTLFVDVDNSMTIAQEEIFGPVVSVVPYDDIDHAIAIANDSEFGLSGTVWSSDIDQALAIARQVQTGTLTVNGFIFEFNCPMGGMKASGLGREMGPEGLSAYLEYKTVSLPAPASSGIFGTSQLPS
jgi:betaine-aldehyde dehydrogenase